MGRILASYLVKVHLHASDDMELRAASDDTPALTNDDVKAAIVSGLEKELGGEVSVSLIERTDD